MLISRSWKGDGRDVQKSSTVVRELSIVAVAFEIKVGLTEDKMATTSAPTHIPPMSSPVPITANTFTHVLGGSSDSFPL